MAGSKSLNSTSSMKRTLCADICRMCKFWSVKATQVFFLAANLNLRLPSFCLSIPMNTKKAAFIVGLCESFIFLVSGRGNIAQIIESIIRLASINMINLAIRPFASHIKPCKAMPVIMPFIYANKYIACHSINATDKPTSRTLKNILFFSGVSPEESCFRIIATQFAKTFGGNKRFCHGWS